MSQENVDYVRRSRETWNDGNLDAFIAMGAEDAEWVIAEENPNARTLRGREEIADYIRDWASTVAGLRIDAARDIDVGDAVVSLGLVSGRAGTDGPDVAVPIAFVTYFDGGRAVRTEEYLDHRKALEVVGLTEHDADADS